MNEVLSNSLFPLILIGRDEINFKSTDRLISSYKTTRTHILNKRYVFTWRRIVWTPYGITWRVSHPGCSNFEFSLCKGSFNIFGFNFDIVWFFKNTRYSFELDKCFFDRKQG